jgi:hypothetical protein
VAHDLEEQDAFAGDYGIVVLDSWPPGDPSIVRALNPLRG